MFPLCCGCFSKRKTSVPKSEPVHSAIFSHPFHSNGKAGLKLNISHQTLFRNQDHCHRELDSKPRQIECIGKFTGIVQVKSYRHGSVCSLLLLRHEAVDYVADLAGGGIGIGGETAGTGGLEGIVAQT